MLISAIYLGIKGIKKNYTRHMSFALTMAGVSMFFFVIKENIYINCAFGLLFFMMLPVANNSLDYLARINIPEEFQGRAWGFIGSLSQMGYVVAYAVSGVSADAIGKITGQGVGKGSAVVIQIGGIILALIALSIQPMKSVHALENASEEHQS